MMFPLIFTGGQNGFARDFPLVSGTGVGARFLRNAWPARPTSAGTLENSTPREGYHKHSFSWGRGAPILSSPAASGS